MFRATRTAIATLAVCTASVSAATLQPASASAATRPPTWVQQFPKASPPASYGAAMAYDGKTKQVVLFGGMGAKSILSGTWEWDGSNWAELHPQTSPPPLYDASMAYDTKTGQIILFGGRGASGVSGSTWEWDGSNWTELHPATSPPARSSASMAYSPAPGVIVLFGGTGASGSALSGTWVWDGTNWASFSNSTSCATCSSPGPLYGASLSTDLASGLVMFGGHGPQSLSSETMLWDQFGWSPVTPVVTPPALYGASMAYYYYLPPGATYASDEEVILFGGTGTSGYLSGTWAWYMAWFGSNWGKLNPPQHPSPRYGAAMVFDSSSDQLLLFGGTGPHGVLDDTWAWEVPTWYPA